MVPRCVRAAVGLSLISALIVCICGPIRVRAQSQYAGPAPAVSWYDTTVGNTAYNSPNAVSNTNARLATDPRTGHVYTVFTSNANNVGHQNAAGAGSSTTVTPNGFRMVVVRTNALGVPQAVQRSYSSDNGQARPDVPTAIAVNPITSEVIIIGYSQATTHGWPITSGSQMQLSAANVNTRAVVWCIDGDNNMYANWGWALQQGNPSQPRGVAIDAVRSRIYVVSYSNGGSMQWKDKNDVTYGLCTSQNNNDWNILAITTGGNYVSQTCKGGSNDDRPFSVDVDSLGNVYVAGMFSGTDVQWGNGYSTTSTGNWDAVLVKFTSSMTTVWAQAVSANAGGSSDAYYRVVVGGDDKLILAGASQTAEVLTINGVTFNGCDANNIYNFVLQLDTTVNPTSPPPLVWIGTACNNGELAIDAAVDNRTSVYFGGKHSNSFSKYKYKFGGVERTTTTAFQCANGAGDGHILKLNYSTGEFHWCYGFRSNNDLNTPESNYLTYSDHTSCYGCVGITFGYVGNGYSGLEPLPVAGSFSGVSTQGTQSGSIGGSTLMINDRCGRAFGSCQNGGTCNGNLAGNAFTCKCAPGFAGGDCRTNINECASQPCLSGGTCSDSVNGYFCACVGGFSGARCQTNINECTSQPCLNGGSCFDAINGFTCKCAGGYSGVVCQTDINECASNPCINGATCDDGPNGYFCDCAGGWSGTRCQSAINECASFPCANGGTCFDKHNGYNCTCAAGYAGPACLTDINECASAPCLNGATCIDLPNSWSCKCAGGFSGNICQTDINECASGPCRNGGTCSDDVNRYLCACPAGYSGASCQTEINECSSQPCANGGTCKDLLNAVTCTCAAGYSGLFCETNINECASQPCQNGGTCNDAVAGFTCSCAGGYSGLLCETDINECTSVPCRNGGTCSDRVNGFTCACTGGWSGAVCQTDINECGSQPCANGGTCFDGPNGLTCACAGGFSGLFCQTNINECASLPCTNGGTCHDAVNGFTCSCVGGYSGLRCQTDINECASNPCVYGSCSDRVNAFNCTCVSGITGTLCDTDINECATNNGGCGATSFCFNFFMSWNCTAYIVPGTIASPNATYSTDPFVFGSLRGQFLRFAISYINTPYSSFVLTLGTVSTPNLKPCVGLTKIGPPNGPHQLSQCVIGAGYGAGYSLFLYQFGSIISRSNETISYPPPILASGSLRQNRTGYGSTEVVSLVLDTAIAVNVAFDGANFDPSVTTVTYGPAGDRERYPCAVIVAQSSANTISCLTLAGSQGSNMFFTVTVGGQVSDVSDFYVSFPDTPFVYRVSGCTDVGNATVDCPTEAKRADGNRIVLTVYGEHFVQQNIAVSVGSRPCANPSVDQGSNGALLTCELPESTGGLRSMTVTSIGQNSAAAPFITYALPTIHSILGCNDTDFSTQNSISNCPRHGHTDITLTGRNFGVAEAVILVGNALCQSVRHDQLTPHRVVYCTIPSGTGLSRPVLLLQSGGGIGANTSLSYEECPAGQYVTGLDCADCDTGQYSSISSSQSCNPCLAGKYTNVEAGASFCFSCPVGRVSSAGVTACTNCTIGSFVGAEAQGQCSPCSPGRFAAVNGSAVCTDCPSGTAQASAAASSCNSCPIGTATSSSGQSVCAPCAAGRFRRIDSAAAECDPCPGGTSQPSPGSSFCVPCAKGLFSAAGFAECQSCIFGTMAPETGSTTCTRCPDYSAANAAFTLCDCTSAYYSTVPTVPDIQMSCRPCPEGSVCDDPGVLYSQLTARNEWWRENNETLTFFRCLLPGHCVGGGCAPNRVGPICAICASGYTATASGLECSACPSQSTSIGATVGYAILILFAVFVVFYVVWRSEAAHMTPKSPYQIVKAFFPEDRTAPNYAYNFKIILSYLQITTTVLGLVEIPWPTDFRRFITYFSFVNLDFIPWGSVQCVATFNFYDKLLVLFIVPFAVLFLVVLVPTIGLILQNRFDYSDDSATRKKRKESRNKIIKLLAFALFLMYPAISQQVLSFFICRPVADRSYLVADFTLPCWDEVWYQKLPLAVIAVIVYPIGIPFVLFVALYRVRRRLKMPHIQLAYGLAYDAYLHVFWWWELVDMLCKLFLTSLLGFFPAYMQCDFGMAICVAYLLCLLLAQPYVRTIDDRMCCTAQVHLFLILLVGATLQESPFQPGSTTDILASVLMFVVLFILVVLVVVHAVIFARKYVRNVQRTHVLKNQTTFVANPLKAGAGGTGTPDASGNDGSGGGGGGTPNTGSDRPREDSATPDGVSDEFFYHASRINRGGGNQTGARVLAGTTATPTASGRVSLDVTDSGGSGGMAGSARSSASFMPSGGSATGMESAPASRKPSAMERLSHGGVELIELPSAGAGASPRASDAAVISPRSELLPMFDAPPASSDASLPPPPPPVTGTAHIELPPLPTAQTTASVVSTAQSDDAPPPPARATGDSDAEEDAAAPPPPAVDDSAI